MTYKTGRPRQTHCKRGHSYEEVGRRKGGSCIQCEKERKLHMRPDRTLPTLEDVAADLAAMRARVARRRELEANRVRFQ